MSDTILPQAKTPKLIVVIAFDRDPGGELAPVFGPQDFPTEERAVRVAKALATRVSGPRIRSAAIGALALTRQASA